MRCKLCGHQFNPEMLACHNSCPMHKHCTLICCPHCGYQVVDEAKSRVARWLERLWPARRAHPPHLPDGPPAPPAPPDTPDAPVPLTRIPVGVPVQVHSFKHMPPKRLARLACFGLAPGSVVQVRQRRPVPVIRIGQTELALSQQILDQIWVLQTAVTPRHS